jgi:hypothetical protein
MTRLVKLLQMVVTHYREAAEHHREEKYLSREEEPHTELRRSIRRWRIHMVNMGWLSRWYIVIDYCRVAHNVLVSFLT